MSTVIHVEPFTDPNPRGPQYYDAPWYRNLLACTECVCRSEAQRVVPGWGPADAEFMILGRNPGKDEDKQGQAFVGRAGNELDYWLGVLGLDRQKLVVTNTVKCHTLKDRPPRVGEINTCVDLWLQQEIAYLTRVQAIIPVGREAARALLGNQAAAPGRLSAYAARIEVFGRAIHVLPLAHPAYFLRSPGKRVQMYNSVLPQVREFLRQYLPEAYERARRHS